MARNSGDYDREIAAVRKVLTPFDVYDYDGVSCPEQYERIRRALETMGQTIGSMDLLIAARACALGATAVPNNDEHFLLVPGLLVANRLKHESTQMSVSERLAYVGAGTPVTASAGRDR